jgi:hypothetical protein
MSGRYWGCDVEEIVSMVPNGAEIVGFVVALAALVSAFVPDGKWPGGANGLIARAVNFLAFNVKHAKNDPNAQ